MKNEHIITIGVYIDIDIDDEVRRHGHRGGDQGRGFRAPTECHKGIANIVAKSAVRQIFGVVFFTKFVIYN